MQFPDFISDPEDISFHYEGVDLYLNEQLLHRWLVDIAKKHYQVIGELQYILCTNEYLQKINWEYLKHKSLTDIITFQYDHTEFISAEIYISIEMVKENSASYGVSFGEELLRVIAHGLLHCLGYKDKTEADIVQMRSKEEESISYFKSVIGPIESLF